MSPEVERARAIVRESGGPELWERLEALERSAPGSPAPRPRPADRADFDVIIAGGGLSLLLAPALARRGLKVAVLDRGRIGAVHREWNASRSELAPLIAEGIVDAAGLEALIVAQYREGVCRWHGGGSYAVRGVLDVAIDAHGLLSRARAAAEAQGVVLLDHHLIEAEAGGAEAITVSVRGLGGAAFELSGKLLVDARGARSPYAGADLVCPTVGGVLRGLDEGVGPDLLDPEVGDILATTEHVEEGRQHVWESFPGRAHESTVYLFYYAEAGQLPPQALSLLFARFFAQRPRFKRGDAALLRPTFGFIPGWSRLVSAPRPSERRVALFGDAAARHSPLTYCGFGSLLRSFGPFADAIQALLEGPPGSLAQPLRGLLEDEAIHLGTGALSAMMSRPSRDPAAMNALLDAAFHSLSELGQEPFRALLQDQMPLPAFLEFLRRTARKRPQVYREVLGLLGARRALRWGFNVASSLVHV